MRVRSPSSSKLRSVPPSAAERARGGGATAVLDVRGKLARGAAARRGSCPVIGAPQPCQPAGRLHAGRHRRLHAAAVDAVRGPVAGEHEVGASPSRSRAARCSTDPAGVSTYRSQAEDVGAPVLGVETRLARSRRRGRPARSQSNAPPALRRPATATRGRARRTRSRSLARGRSPGSCVSPARLVEHAAEVADRLRTVGRLPGLARQQVGHVAVGVERLDVAAGDRVLVVLPAELRGRAV